MEIRVEGVVDEKSKKKELLEERIFLADSFLKTLKHAAETNDAELWDFAENSLINVLEDQRYRLSEYIKQKYYRAFNNIIPGEELSMKLMGLKDSEIVDRDSLPTQSLKRGRKARTTSKSNSRDISRSEILRKCYLDIGNFESGEYLDTGSELGGFD